MSRPFSSSFGFTGVAYTDFYEPTITVTLNASSYVSDANAGNAAIATPGLQSALNALAASPGVGKKLVLSAGVTYMTNAALTLTGGNTPATAVQEIEIDGNNATIKLINSASAVSSVFIPRRVKNFFIHDLTFDQNYPNRRGSNSSDHGVLAFELCSPQIGFGRGVFAYVKSIRGGCPDGWGFRGADSGGVDSSKHCYNLLLYKCEATDFYRNGLTPYNCHNFQVLGGFYGRCGVGGVATIPPQTGIDVEPNQLCSDGSPGNSDHLYRGVTLAQSQGRQFMFATGKAANVTNPDGSVTPTNFGCVDWTIEGCDIYDDCPNPLPFTNSGALHIIAERGLVQKNVFHGFKRRSTGPDHITGTPLMDAAIMITGASSVGHHIFDNRFNNNIFGRPMIHGSDQAGTGHVITNNHGYNNDGAIVQNNGGAKFTVPAGSNTDDAAPTPLVPTPPWDVTFAGEGGGGPGGAGIIGSDSEITIPAGVSGNVSFPHALGEVPKFIVLASNLRGVGAAGGANANQNYGVAQSATKQWATCALDVDGGATVAGRSAFRNDCCFVLGNQAGTSAEEMRAVFVSMDENEVVINITDATAADRLVQMLVVSGQGLEVDIGSINVTSADQGNNVTYPVLPFQGKFLHLVTAGAGATNSLTTDFLPTVGAVQDAAAQWTASWSDNGAEAAANSKCVIDNTKCIRHLLAASGGTAARLGFIAWTLTGFTLAVEVADLTDRLYGYLALGGDALNVYVGTDSQKTSAGTKVTNTPGVKPQLLLFFGTNATALGTVADGAKPSIGWALPNSNEQRVIASSMTDGSAPIETATASAADKCIKWIGGAAGAVVAEAELDSVADGSYTLDYTTADATARLYGVVALELPISANVIVAVPAGIARPNPRAIGSVTLDISTPNAVINVVEGMQRTRQMGEATLVITNPSTAEKGTSFLGLGLTIRA